MLPNRLPDKPFFSIIIPTLNEENCLPVLLENLKRQSARDLEILVVDGQSTDKTTLIAKSFPKTKVIVSPKRNVGFQRNLGAEKAIGNWLIFIDADTQLPPDFLEEIKRQLADKPPAVFTTKMRVDSEKFSDKTIIAIINFMMEITKQLAVPSVYGAMIGCKKTAFKKAGGFNTLITFGEDHELVRRLIKYGYSYKLFRKPNFIFSLRRARKEGTLNLIQKYIFLNFNLIFNKYPHHSGKIYPMTGGSYYTAKKPRAHTD